MGLFSTSPAERYGPTLLDELPIGISVYRLPDRGDAHSLVLAYANAAAGRIVGFDVQKEIGRRLVEVVPGIAKTDFPEVYAGVVRSGEPLDLGTIQYGDERIRKSTFAIRALPVGSDAVALVFENVEGRAEVQELHEAQGQLAAETARYRSLVEASAVVVWTTTPEGALLTDLGRWSRLTGQSPEESAGDGWVQAVHPDDRAGAAAAWAEAVENESLYRTQYRLRHADGSYRWTEARGAPVRDASGATVEWVGVNVDIEAETEAAAALAASEARFRTLFDALDDVVLVYPLGPDGPEPFVAFNEAAVERYGYSREELASMTIADIVAPARFNVDNALAELRKTRRSTFESTHLTKGGERLAMSTAARLVEYDGRLCVVALCRDDTARRQFRRDIARSNRELEGAVAERTSQLEAFSQDLKILHGISTASHQTRADLFDAYLRAGCEMFDLPIGILSSTPADPKTGVRGYRVDAIVSTLDAIKKGDETALANTFCDLVVEREETVAYADAREEAPENPACAQRGLRAFIGTPVCIDDEIVGTLNFSSPEPREGGFSPVERDLIEVVAQAIGRRLAADRAEAAEAEARQQYRAIVETVDAGVIVVDRDSRIIMSNPSARELLGLDVDHGHDETDEMMHRWPVVDVNGVPVPPEELPESEVIRTGKAVRGTVHGIAEPGSDVRWYRVNATPLDRDEDGELDAVVVSFHDVTDFREAARAAEGSQVLLRSVLDGAPEGVYGIDLDGVTTFANKAAVEMTGYSADEQVGVRQHTLLHHHRADGEPYPVEDCPIYQTLRDGQPRTCDTEVFWHKDGSAIPVHYSVSPIRADGALAGAVVTFERRS